MPIDNRGALMHAYICEPDDTKTIERFRAALSSMNAELLEQSWAVGVDIHLFRIRSDTLTVFQDAWSVDVEGPDELVLRILSDVKEASVNGG
jgi:hypothetical protein